ncbi:MAG: nucleotide exchange factor GrpE [Gemmatimonas sp. 13_1_20CM_3_60_15]|nr:MAG: nucleotide exchange factor GrpE [Gemmatimonas sp. 13_1_20CM_3_60_15]
MTNKRHASPSQPPQSTTPRAPSLDPDTGEPLDDVSAPTSSSLPTANASQSGAGAETAPTAPSEADVWKDRHLRLAAEFDNFRKRITKERSEMWMRAQADLVARLADALDDLSRFAHIDPADIDAKTLHEGVDLVERKVWKELEAAGVTRIDRAGVPFDPNVHEAVTTQPAAKPEDDHTVGQVVQPGYKMRDILLRPARVVVLTWQGK